jgi:hypothetical protein
MNTESKRNTFIGGGVVGMAALCLLIVFVMMMSENGASASNGGQTPSTHVASTVPHVPSHSTPTTIVNGKSRPNTSTTEVLVTWEQLGLKNVEPLDIDQVTPGMQICVVHKSNGGRKLDLVVNRVFDFVPMTPGAVPPYYLSEQNKLLILEWSFEGRDALEADPTMIDSDLLGLTGSGDDTRTYAGTCDQPVSAEDLPHQSLPGAS